MAAEQAFMDDLFAGLDAGTFGETTLSSPPIRPVRLPALSSKRVNVRQVKRVELAPAKAQKTVKQAPLKVKSAAALVKSPINKVKQKQKSAEDYGGLLQGCEDWSDIEMDLGPAKTPFAQQYTRFSVQGVYEEIHPQSKRMCKVLRVARDGPSTSTFALDKVYLADDWYDTTVKPDDIVNILGPLPPQQDSLLLNYANNANSIILEPDTLLTATAIANATPCLRKPLLQDRLRASGAASEAMLYGTLLHELFQTCLRKGRWDDDFRTATALHLCTLQSFLAQIWQVGLELGTVREHLSERSKTWPTWAANFIAKEPQSEGMLTDPRGSIQEAAKICITNVHDIEEDIWSPRLGLKGKIDVSLQARILDQSASVAESAEKGIVAPFEIKTGRSTSVMEHRAQTLLYTLMMSERYGWLLDGRDKKLKFTDATIQSGLLYYTQTDQVFRVAQAKNEVRGLLQNRNELAAYTRLRGKPTNSKFDDDIEDCAAPPSSLSQSEEDTFLPEPLDQPKTCKRCYAVDSCMLYRRTVESYPIQEGKHAEDLTELYNTKTEHLTDQHAAFFKHWESLVSLEERDMAKEQRDIWTKSAAELEETGRCFADMVVDLSFDSEKECENRGSFPFVYKLVRRKGKKDQLHSGHIAVNDPVVFSVQEPQIVGLATGYVLAITSAHIIVGVNHALLNLKCLLDQNLHSPVFRIDKNELATGMGRLRDNLAQLFYALGDVKRRALVVDLAPPTFSTMQSVLSEEELSLPLNQDQKDAIALALNAHDYACILGMPGTGKTTTTVELIAALVKRGNSVLLTSYTHSAVDNILLKLKEKNLDVLRLGNKDKVMPELHGMTISEGEKFESVEQLEDRFMAPQVVATTTLSINHPLFSKRRFDFCIVDEASQIALPACLGPLRFAETFILVGDHKQLPPLVRSRAARLKGYDESLFKRLCEAHPHAVAALTQQYRMNDEIMALSNELVYSGQLKCGSSSVAAHRLTLAVTKSSGWISRVLSGPSVLFANTDNLFARETRKARLISNDSEVALVRKAVTALVQAGLAASKIGVISMYRHQIKQLSYALAEFPEIEILTADKSQGRDKECILVSFVRSNEELKVGELIKDWRRLNVTITRAKAKLILFGSRSTLEPTLPDFFRLLDERGFLLDLEENATSQDSTPKRRLSPPSSPGKSLSPSKKRNRV